MKVFRVFSQSLFLLEGEKHLSSSRGGVVGSRTVTAFYFSTSLWSFVLSLVWTPLALLNTLSGIIQQFGIIFVPVSDTESCVLKKTDMRNIKENTSFPSAIVHTRPECPARHYFGLRHWLLSSEGLFWVFCGQILFLMLTV